MFPVSKSVKAETLRRQACYVTCKLMSCLRGEELYAFWLGLSFSQQVTSTYQTFNVLLLIVISIQLISIYVIISSSVVNPLSIPSSTIYKALNKPATNAATAHDAANGTSVIAAPPLLFVALRKGVLMNW